jgi:long-chain acyl-CoA synthetase
MLDPKIASAKTIPEAVTTAAQLFGDAPALKYKTKPGDPYSGNFTFNQLAKIPRAAGTALVEQFGLRPEQKVAFISENRYEYNFGDLAVMNGGGIPWGLYDYDVKDLDMVEYKLTDSETELIVASPVFLENVRTIVRSSKTPLKKIIVMDMPYDKIQYRNNESPFSDILKNGRENTALIDERLRGLDRSSVARLIYTSGTTGRPKGVMLTHTNLLSNVVSCSAMLNIDPGERLIAYLPEAHSFQGFVTLAALFNGASVWYSHKTTLLQDIALVNPTLFPGVPVVFKRFAEGMRERVLEITKGFIDLGADYSQNLIKNLIRRKILGPRILNKVGFGHILRAVSGSAKLDLEHARIFENIGIIVLEGYGISETSPVISTERHSMRRRGSVGKPIPNVDVKILSLMEGPDGKRHFLPPGEPGEVVVNGPNIFKGYWKDEHKTARSFYDGYYKTGDLGYIDKDGFLFIHGRVGLQVKMINGEFVDLDELAANMLRHTSLIQSAAVDAEMKDYAVAVVSLAWEPESIEEIGEKLGVHFDGDIVKFASDERVVQAIKNELEENKQKFGDPRSPGVPKKFLIVAPMSPETGEITSTLKFRVRKILEKYMEQIDELRKSSDIYKVHVK